MSKLSSKTPLPAAMLSVLLSGCQVSVCSYSEQLKEIRAIKRIVTIRSAEQNCLEGLGRYCQLSELVTADGSRRPLTVPDLDGYDLEVATSPASYSVLAAPTGEGRKYRRSFYADQKAIRESFSPSVASETSPVLR